MASKLPEDVWALILQHVPVADRLKHCALVCTKLSRAAAAATVALKVSLFRGYPQQQRLAEAFNSYLQHHGSHVTSLVLDSAEQPLTQLPCPQLLHLDISLADPLQLGLQNGLPGVLDSCATALTSLKLRSCTVAPDGGSLSRLSVLAALQELQVQYVQQPDGVYATLPGSVLPSLAHLTRLDVSDMGGLEAVHHVSSLTNLSVLHICGVEGPQPLRLAPDIAPGFALPASLQQLCLGDGVVLDLAMLSAATQLTSVELNWMRVEVQDGGVSSGAALLAAVAGLQQLDSLELNGFQLVGWPAPSAAYTALTASSKLQRLVVRRCGLAEGVWEHVFPPERRCPALRWFGAREDDFVNGWGGEAVSRVVRSCPGLQQLELNVRGEAPVAALEPLTELTSLLLFVDCVGDQASVEESVQHVAAITSLQRLELFVLIERDAAGAADATLHGAAAMLPLSGLTQLAQCVIQLGAHLDEDDEGQQLLSFWADNDGPDVSLQLLEKCLEDSNCQPAVVAAAKQLAQQQAEHHAELQQRLAQLQQRVAQQEQHHTERLAQQDQQIAALQAQVQQLLQFLPHVQQQH